MSFLKIWLIATAVFIVGALVWGFAPILVPLVLVFVGLTVLVAAIVRIARALERWRPSRADDQDFP